MARDPDALRRLYGSEADTTLGPRPPGVSLVWVLLVLALGLLGVMGLIGTLLVLIKPDPVADRLTLAGTLEPGETVTLMYGTELDGCLITPDAFVTWTPQETTRASLMDAVLTTERLPSALVVTSDETVRCVFTDDVSYEVFEELLRRNIRPSREPWRPGDPRLERRR